MYGSLIPYFATFWIVGSRAQNWASIVLCPTNSTQSFAIYKLTGRIVGWLAQHCTFIVLCPPNSTRSSATYKLTEGIQDWWAQYCDCLQTVILSNII